MAYTDDKSRPYILKEENEVDVGLSFNPTDPSKATSVTISDEYSTDNITNSAAFSAAYYSKITTIDASSRSNSISIIGNANKNLIKGGKNDDFLNGGAGNDTLTGGSGADVFLSSAGKNIVTDYKSTEGDIIQLASGITPTKAAVSGQNVVFTFSDKSTMTLNNAKNVPLTVIDYEGNPVYTLSQPFGDTLLSASSDTTVLNASLNTLVKDIDGSAATVSAGLSIVGNTVANSIKGSDFTNNTIEAGIGNDTLTGGVGVTNTYIFSEGQGSNVITNFQFGSNGDRILVKTGKIIGHTIKKDDVIISLALNGKKTTTITVEGGRNQLITVLKPNGDVDTGNTIIYRDPTDYIVTNESIVTPLITGSTAKLIDASTEEYKLKKGTYITGNSIANTIKGSDYADTISGGAGKDVITGGKGGDIFLYASGEGNKTITDFTASDTDIIRLADPDTTISTSVYNTAKGANDVIFTVTNAAGKNKGTITLTDGKDQLITIERATVEGGTVANNGIETIAAQKYGVDKLTVDVDAIPIDATYAVQVQTGSAIEKYLYFTDTRKVDASYNSKVVTIDGSEASKEQEGKLYLIGNSGKNSIVGSKYGENTLQGGKGNDTLVGSSGYTDIFIFDSVDGTDAVIGFESSLDAILMSDEDIHITASALVTKKGANDVQLTIGKTKVVVQGAADTVESVNAKGKKVTEYIPQKLKIYNGDGSWYKMTYGGTLAKVEDGDVTLGGTLDFSANTNIATIDAGALILDGTAIDTVDGSEVLVAASSVEERTTNVNIIGSSKANTIISASNGLPHGGLSPAVLTTVTGGAGNDVFILSSGGDMLITDYNTRKNEADKIKLLDNQTIVDGVSIEGSASDGSSGDLLLTVSTKTSSINDAGSTIESSYDNVITVVGAADKIITVVDADGNESKQKYGDPVIIIDNSSSPNIIAGSKVTAVENAGRTKAINITSTGSNAISIEAGTGNDTLNGGPSGGEVSTLTGGAGKDIFYHTNGKFAEVITKYEVGKDKLEFIEGMSIASISAQNDTDIILHFATVTKIDGLTNLNGEGHITVLGGYGEKITVVKESTEEVTTTKNGVTTTTTKTVKNENAQIYGFSELYILDADGTSVDASDGANNGYVELVDASARSAKKPIAITGNATNNTSVNPHEVVNNNTLIGGKGADTLYTGEGGTTALTGGAGGDIFVYRGGNVTITDYAWNKKDANCDKIMVANSTFNSIADIFSPTIPSHYNGEDVVFNFGNSHVLTIQNAKGKNIAIIDGSGATIGSSDVYANPREWIINNKTDPNPANLKSTYIDNEENNKDHDYNAISASSRTKAATIEGARANTEYNISGSKAADYLIGNSESNTISGANGNDTIKANGGGNGKALTDSTAKFNVLTGGDGNDVFYYNPAASSNEYSVITDYTVGKDTIKLAEGFYISNAEVTNTRATLTGADGKATLTGVQASVSAAGTFEVVKNGKKTVAKTTETTPSDVILTIKDSNDSIRGYINVWDAGGYSEIIDTSVGVSVAAINPYKFTIAEEYTNAKGKTAFNTYAVDLVSDDIVVVNADGTTINASPNPSVVNISASTSPARTKAMHVIGNSKANSITGTAKADTLVGGGAANSTADTLVGGLGNDYFILDGKGDVYIDDYSSEKGNYDRIQLAEDVKLIDGTASDTNLIMTYQLGTESNAVKHYATIKGAASTKITLAGSDGKAGAQVYGSTSITVANADGDKVDVTSNRKVQTIDASKRTKNVGLVGNTVTSTILGGKKNDTIDTSALSITNDVVGAYIDAGAGNDLVYGSKGADSVLLGAGVDTFFTGGGNDTVTTGDGNDVIIYQGNHVVITDYTSKKDRIELDNYKLYTTERYSVDTDGTTIILNIATTTTNGTTTTEIKSNDHSIRLLNAVDKVLLITNAEGTTDTITLNDPTVRKVTNSDGSNIEPASGSGSTIRTIDASSRSNPVTITGSADTTLIKGGKGTDTIKLTAASGGTIQGGKGNDVMTGVAGKTFYAYTTGDGKDVITNYTAGDIIVLGSSKTAVNETKSKVSGNDYILTINSGNITLKGAASTEIKVLKYGATEADTYNPQSTTSTSSITTSSKTFLELIEDDNYITSGNELSDIIEAKYQINAELRMQNADLREINSALVTGIQLNNNQIYKQKSNLTAK